MKIIKSLILIIIIFTTLFYLSMEESNAYNYREIPIYFDANMCGGNPEKYNACYNYNDEVEYIGVNQKMTPETLKKVLSHEYGHSIWNKTLTQKEKDIWNKFYDGSIDSALQQYKISTDTWNNNWRKYALNSNTEMFGDLNRYYETDKEYKPMTKEWLANMWIGKVRDKYGITKESGFDYGLDYWNQ